jgi:hypothetical protein
VLFTMAFLANATIFPRLGMEKALIVHAFMK